MSIIAITGFMAAGKTTVARELGRHLNYPVLDLDDLIIERERCSIRELIEQLGEPEFRNVETDVLRQVFVDNSSAVIALGGGAWTIDRNRELISEHGAISVWIDAPFEVCWSRIEETMGTRPFARDRDSTSALFQTRLPLYEKTSIHVKLTGHEPVSSIAESIAIRIKEHVTSTNKSKLLK